MVTSLQVWSVHWSRRVCVCSEQKDDPDEVKLKAEMQQYGDIVRIDMVDTYADLSMKTLRMFSILPQKIEADFYFKIDDDVAVNVDALADYLDARRSQGNLYLVGLHQSVSSHLFGASVHIRLVIILLMTQAYYVFAAIEDMSGQLQSHAMWHTGNSS